MTRALAAASLLLLLLLGHALAGADEERQAEALNAEGKALYEKRDYPGALAKFRAAIAIAPRAKYWFNLASVLDDTGRFAEAADAYERYLTLSDADARTGKWVARRLAELERKVARLLVVTGHADAKLAVNGVDPARGSGDRVEIRVDPGTYVIAASADGRTASETVSVVAGQALTIDLSAGLEPPPPAVEPDAGVAEPQLPAGDAAPIVPPAPRTRRVVTPWWKDKAGGLLAGGAVAAFAVSVGFYVASSGDLDDAAAAPTLADHDAEVDSARSRRNVSRYAAIAGAAFAAGAALRYILVGDRVREVPVDVGVIVTPGGGGLLLEGRF